MSSTTSNYLCTPSPTSLKFTPPRPKSHHHMPMPVYNFEVPSSSPPTSKAKPYEADWTPSPGPISSRRPMHSLDDDMVFSSSPYVPMTADKHYLFRPKLGNRMHHLNLTGSLPSRLSSPSLPEKNDTEYSDEGNPANPHAEVKEARSSYGFLGRAYTYSRMIDDSLDDESVVWDDAPELALSSAIVQNKATEIAHEQPSSRKEAQFAYDPTCPTKEEHAKLVSKARKQARAHSAGESSKQARFREPHQSALSQEKKQKYLPCQDQQTYNTPACSTGAQARAASRAIEQGQAQIASDLSCPMHHSSPNSFEASSMKGKPAKDCTAKTAHLEHRIENLTGQVWYLKNENEVLRLVASSLMSFFIGGGLMYALLR